MVHRSLVSLAAILGLAASTGSALAVPFCTEHRSGLSVQIDSMGRPHRDYDAEFEAYRQQLQQMGVDATRVESWNGCLRAYVRNSTGGEDMRYFDPNTLEPVN
jgi:hypothetical protein